ncbi:MAG TPA: hypothetical protein VGM90_36590 [Kofleriaceae bacterium]|jgi:hypothetical protein
MTWEPLLDRLTRLRDSWPAPPWTWDSRFSAIASSFEAAQEAAIRTSARLAFPRGWTMKSLENAPAELQAVAQRTGGLRAEQRLLGGDPQTCPTLFGLWWPWGGGDKITLRIGLVDVAGDADPLRQIRALFDITA